MRADSLSDRRISASLSMLAEQVLLQGLQQRHAAQHFDDRGLGAIGFGGTPGRYRGTIPDAERGEFDRQSEIERFADHARSLLGLVTQGRQVFPLAVAEHRLLERQQFVRNLFVCAKRMRQPDNLRQGCRGDDFLGRGVMKEDAVGKDRVELPFVGEPRSDLAVMHAELLDLMGAERRFVVAACEKTGVQFADGGEQDQFADVVQQAAR